MRHDICMPAIINWRVPIIMPMAKVPTAMINTTWIVRPLFSQRSRQTLSHNTPIALCSFRRTQACGLNGLEMVAHDLPVGDLDLARHRLCQFLVMGDDDHRLAVGYKLVKEVKYTMRCFLVQVAGRLVGDDQGRVVGQGADDSGALLLAAADHAGQLVRLVGQPDHVEQVERAGTAFARASICRPGPWAG